MSGPFRFAADELGGSDSRQLPGALEAARALEQVADDAPVITESALSDRVMAAIADEPVPVPGGFLLPLRRLGIVGGFADSLRQAWASSGRGRPALARAMALTYVLVVAAAGVSLAGAATFGAAGALGILAPKTTVEASHDPSAVPETAPLLHDESSPEPTERPEASEAPAEETDGPDNQGGGSEPEASDNHGGDSGPGGGDDGAGPGESDGPDASDDHSGSDDGSGPAPAETDDHSGSDDNGSGGGSAD